MSPGGEVVRIRAGRLLDIEPILELWGAMMRDHEANEPRLRLAPGAIPAYRAYLGFHLGNEESLVLVAVSGERIVGFVLATISRNLPMFLPPRFGYLSDLVVDGKHRRRGIGRRLVAGIREWLAEHDIETVQLQYYCFNEAGGAFWKSMGFDGFYVRTWLTLGDEPA
jgi:ribosomal protein S18 acetylase RimI-like enzyme